MKHVFVFLIIGIVSCAANSSAGDPVLSAASYEAVYIPNGFDSNDNVQLMAEGIFPTNCYKIAQPKARIDQTKKIILLDARAYRYSGQCDSIEISFQQEVNLGIIKSPGNYKVKTSQGKLIGNILIKPATTDRPDDYFYAPVQGVAFENTSQNRLTVQMYFKTRCVELDRIEVEKQDKVIVILPIAKIVQSMRCLSENYPVSSTIDIGPLKSGRYLLHVRSSGSQALNQLVTVQ